MKVELYKNKKQSALKDKEQMNSITRDLLTAFVWSDTPQGHDYWLNVWNNLGDIKNDHNDDAIYLDLRKGVSGNIKLVQVDSNGNEVQCPNIAIINIHSRQVYFTKNSQLEVEYNFEFIKK